MIETIGNATLYLGDCTQVLYTLEENSVDCVITDPPYELGFMNRQWDRSGVAFSPETWAAVLRVAKPGAWMAAFASTRGYHRMVCAIEDAGWRIHPMNGWITGQGFPKAKKVDAPGYEGFRYGGQVQKPALEPICIAQKPFSEKTGTANVLKWGTGAVNVDAGRVGIDGKLGGGMVSMGRPKASEGWDRPWMHDLEVTARKKVESAAKVAEAEAKGRWPANLAHDGSPEVMAAFAKFGERNGGHGPWARGDGGISTAGCKGQKGLDERYATPGTAARFFQSCPLEDADRFFYSSKASRADRMGFPHPTIKPVSLLRWLTRMLCPPGGVVLDPFAGTATGAAAALAEGMRAIAIEAEPEHFEWCLERLRKAEPQQMELTA